MKCVHFDFYITLSLLTLIGISTHQTNAQATNTDSWHVGCYKLQSNSTRRTLLGLLEGLSANVSGSAFYHNFNDEKSPPLSRHCIELGLPYIAVLSSSRFYCIADITHLGPADQDLDENPCSDRCPDRSLPCGSSNQQFISLYNNSKVPYMQHATFYEPANHLFTHRNIEFQIRVTFNQSYGLNVGSESEDQVMFVPVHCLLYINSQSAGISRAREEISFTGDQVFVKCELEHWFIDEGTYNISVEIVSAWETKAISDTITLAREVPALPDIEVYLSDHSLPTCISSQHELDITEHQQTVKVYVDTPTPFRATVGQGTNMTFHWMFNNDTENTFTTRALAGSSTTSVLTHTFTTLGVNFLSVNFSNPFGHAVSTLAVIAVSKDIHNVTVTPVKQVLLLREPTHLKFSIITSSRYFTYIEVNQGDGRVHRLSVVDRAIDARSRPRHIEGYNEMTSSYGVGCTLNLDISVYYHQREGLFDLTWSVFNNHTIINSSLPITFSVLSYIADLKLSGHLSYEVGLNTNITATFGAVSYNHTTSWTLRNAVTDLVIYILTEERGDTFIYRMNETGTFTLRCEVRNAAHEREEQEEMLFVIDRLGNLTVSSLNIVAHRTTHQTMSFSAELSSGVGAEFVWDVSAVNNSVAHVVMLNLGLVNRAEVTFTHPDIYVVKVLARVGSSMTPEKFVQRVEVYEPITYITCEEPPRRRNSSGCGISTLIQTGSNVDISFHFPGESITRALGVVNHTIVDPSQCPDPGAYDIRVIASNRVSTLELTCPLIVLPKIGSISLGLTAACRMQLVAETRSQSGVVVPLNAVYMWRYFNNGVEMQEISVLPFTMIDSHPSLTHYVNASLTVIGVRDGFRRVPYDLYQRGISILEHPNVFKPHENVSIIIRNTSAFSGTLTLRVFSQQCVFDLAAVSEAVCNVTVSNPGLSTVTLTTSHRDSISSRIAAVPELPRDITLVCPGRVIPNSRSQTLVSANFGQSNHTQFYAYFTWYLGEERAGYSSTPHMLLRLDTEGTHTVTVVAANAWGSVNNSCLITAARALIDLEILPAPVHRLNIYNTRVTRDATALTLLVHGPRTLANLTIDYGDGDNEIYIAADLEDMDWRSVDAVRSSVTFHHDYRLDTQYKVRVTASTEHTTLNSTGVVYRSVRGITYRPLDRRFGYEYEVNESVILMVEVAGGDYLTFKWSHDSHTSLQVIETGSNITKANVTLYQLGKRNIVCKVYNPAYPGGLVANFTNIMTVVTKPESTEIVALVENNEVNSTQLEGYRPINVTFVLRYWPGPHQTPVSFYADYEGNQELVMVTMGRCENDNSRRGPLCKAYAWHVYDRAGTYRPTARMQLDYGEANMEFRILPPDVMIRFLNAPRVEGHTPVYYVPFGETANFSIELQTQNPVDENVTYSWSFGDQAMTKRNKTDGYMTNESHKYLSTLEAGFSVRVTATAGSGIDITGIARVLVLRRITRVEIRARNQTWTEDNEGKIYVTPDDVKHFLLLVLKVYPDNIPFESCHIINGEPFSPPTVSKSFYPENYGEVMHKYDKTLEETGSAITYVRRMIVSAMCVEVNRPGVVTNRIYAEPLTIYKRLPIYRLTYIQDSEIKVGENVTHYCLGAAEGTHYKQYVNGEKVLDGIDETHVTFIPRREGEYNLTCVANNGVSEKTVTKLLPILNHTCYIKLSITSKRTYSRDETEPSTVNVWYRSEPVMLQGMFIRRNRKCDFATAWKVSWDITQVVDGQEESVPNIRYAESDDLYLRPGTLPTGSYTVHFIVSIPGTMFAQRESLPITIKRTPFRAIISGGIGRKINFNKAEMVELDGSESYDPDNPAREDLDFLWACHLLRELDMPCYKGKGVRDIELGKGRKFTVNTTQLNTNGTKAFEFILVVFKGNESVVTRQIWEQRTERSAAGGDGGLLSIRASCETCVDGRVMNASTVRPVVFKASCPKSKVDCEGVRYEWNVKYVVRKEDGKTCNAQSCELRDTFIIPPTTTTTTAAFTSTAPTSTSTTQPPPVNLGGLPGPVPSEESSDEAGQGNGRGIFFPPGGIPIEEGSVTPNTRGGGDGSSTEMPFGDLEFRVTRDPTESHTPRPAFTTSLAPEGETVYTLDGCEGCAFDGDSVETTYNKTLYELPRLGSGVTPLTTVGGMSSKDLIILPNTLSERRIYIVELRAESSSGDLALDYYLLTIGELSGKVVCYPSFTNRDNDGWITAWYNLTEHAGKELVRGYEFMCSFRNLRLTPEVKNYQYAYEAYIERVPGELEIVFRGYFESYDDLLQRFPAGFPEHNYQVNIVMYVVDLYGNRQLVCPQGDRPVAHRILPQHYTDQSASDYIYGLVELGGDLDWYDNEKMWGNVFTARTNMLSVSEVLNRVAELETGPEQIRRRTETRARLIAQLKETPHRYTAEVEQKLVVLRSVVKIKSEVDGNATKMAAHMLVELVKMYIAYAPKDRPRDVNFTSMVVIDISSKLIKCFSQTSVRNMYSDTYNLDRAINNILLMSARNSVVPMKHKMRISMTHGITILSQRSTEMKDVVMRNKDAMFKVPATLLGELDNVEECHTAHMLQYADNPYRAGVDSMVTALTLYDCDGNEIRNVKTNNIHSHIALSLPIVSSNLTQQSANYTIHKKDINLHVMDFAAAQSPVSGRSFNVIFNFDMVAGHTFPLAVLVRKNLLPTPHKGQYDKIFYVHTKDSELHIFFEESEIRSVSRLYLAVADDNFNEGKPREREVIERNYSMSSWWSECVYWNTEDQQWSNEGCAVTKETTLTVTHCSCNHLTAFASRREVVYMELTRQLVDSHFETKYYPTTAVMVILCVTFYVVLAVVCSMADRKSPVQEQVLPIEDNSPTDGQRYIITIETGSEPGSGTSAKVSLVIHGEVGMSETRELVGPADTHVFQTNSRDTFLLTLPASLGPIWKVQLWHNNKGSSPGWYVKRVTVRDVETGQSYYFMCEHWLAVEESDGKVEREFMALDAHIGFSVVFKVKAPQYFNDYHLIRSLIYKPTYSHFSRVERLTCVFVGLLAHMALCTAYYYSEVEEYRGQYNLFDLSSNTVLVSLIVNVIACPLMLGLSMMFRRSCVGGRSTFKPKDSRKVKLNAKNVEAMAAAAADTQSQLPGSHSLLEQSILHWQSLQEWAQKQWERRYQKALLAGEELSAVEIQMQEQVLTLASTQQSGGIYTSHVGQSKVGSQSDVKQLITPSDSGSNVTPSQGSSSVRAFIKSRRWVLPPWFRFVAWFLSVACAAGCGFSTIYYSREFQEGRFVLWLQSIFVTFLFCNFLIQPLGILLKAIGTALVFRRDPTVLQHFPDRYEEDIEEIRIRTCNLTGEDEITRGTRARQRSRYLRFARPPQEKQLIAARKRTMKEKKFIRLGMECAVLVLVLVLLIVIVFCCDRDQAFRLNINTKCILATNKLTARRQAFSDISKPSEMWNWLEEDLKELLFTEHAANLGVSIIIGNATRLKQVRVKREACAAKGRMPSWTMPDVCYPPYSSFSADTEAMRLTNRNITYSQVDSNEDAVLYGQLSHYSESGYDVMLPVTEPEFARALLELKTSGWIDKQTRAVFLEFTIFNLPTHLYCTVTAMFEFSPTGQVLVQLEVDSAKLYRYRSAQGYVVLTAELLFIFVYLCQLHFNIVTMVQLQKKYFTRIWNILDCLYLLFSLAYIILHLYRFEVVELLHNELRQTFHSSFVSMAPLIFWDRLLRLLLGLLLFITLIKVLKLFRYVKTFARLGNVYRSAFRDIRGFTVFFLIIVIMYTNLGVALFQSVSLPFSDYWRGVTTVTGYLTGAVHYKEFENTMPFWGGVFIVLLTFTASGLLTALMVAILSYHFRNFKQDPILAMDLKEAARFLMKRFSRKRKDKERQEEKDDSQDLSPEFALAEMEYQVEELLFKMSALCDGVSLPNKSSMYYTTDSDVTIGGGDDLLSSGGGSGRDKIEDGSLTRLLQLQGIGTEIRHGSEQMYTRSQLELDVLRQLQLSNPRDPGINVWDDMRGVRVERLYSDELASENDVPIHRAEYHNPVFHSYQGGNSDDDDDSFISIPDESHTPFVPHTPSPPPKRNKERRKKQKQVRHDNKPLAQAEVYELTERSRSRTPPEIEYHNDAYVSDVEVELDIEFEPNTTKIRGLRKSRSQTSRPHGSSSYQNLAYRDDEGKICQQSDV